MAGKRLIIGLIICGIMALGVLGAAIYFGLFYESENDVVTVNSTEYNVTDCAELNGLCTTDKAGYFSACSGLIPDCSCMFVDCEPNYCVDGACVSDPADNDTNGDDNDTDGNDTEIKCGDIVNPTDQTDCNAGWCKGSSTCVFFINGLGDNECGCDRDGDGIADSEDAFPNDPNEWEDTDGDGTGDNADLDDDGDGWTDAEEAEAGTDQLDPDDHPDYPDSDLDGILDIDDLNPDDPDNPDWWIECTGTPPGEDGEDCWHGVCTEHGQQKYKCIYGGFDLGCTCVLRSAL